MNWTLQFVPPEKRAALIRGIFDSLIPGGCLIVSEKVRSSDAATDALFTEFYYDFKRRRGYNETEISRKREALDNVLVPFTAEQNLDLFRNAGFASADIFLRNFNFCSFLAVKSRPEEKTGSGEVPLLELNMEYAAIQTGIKKVWREGVPSGNERYAEDLRLFAKAKNLYIEFSDFVVPPDKTPFYSSGKVSVGRRFWISREEKHIRRFKYLDEKYMSKYVDAKNDAALQNRSLRVHREMGRLLGYPECCIAFHDEQSLLDMRGEIQTANVYANFVLRALENTRSCSYLLNNLIHGKHMNLIVHKPCSYDCEASIRIAKKVLGFFKKTQPEYHAALMKFLPMPVVFFEDQSRIVVEGRLLAPRRLRFSKLHPRDEKSRLLIEANRELLGGSDTIEFRGGEVICLLGKRPLGAIPIEGARDPFPLILDFKKST